MKGTLKFYNNEKGYGFIFQEQGTPQIFFHISGVREGEELKAGDRVAYETRSGHKGPEAFDVHTID